MRTHIVTQSAALLLAFFFLVPAATAQQPQGTADRPTASGGQSTTGDQPPTTPGDQSPATTGDRASGDQAGGAQSQAAAAGSEAANPLGTLDVSIRGSSVSGDRARFERYRDVRSAGVGINLDFQKEGPSWFGGFGANNVGYRDQRYVANFENSRLKVEFLWDQVPLNYGFKSDGYVATPYTSASEGVLRLDPAARLGWRTSAAGAAVPFASLAQPIDLRQQRHTLNLNVVFAATRTLDVKFGVQSYTRSGDMPWAGTFGFSNAVEMPRPVDERSTDVTAGAEWSIDRAMVRAEWRGSFFSNNVESLVFDNPGRTIDSPTAGSAQGRMALPPSSHDNTVSAAALVRLPARSTITGSLAVSSLTQNATLIPYTINTAIAAPAPPRATADTDVRLTSGTVNFNTHPAKDFTIRARYRLYDRNNRTPDFNRNADVLYDQTLETLEDEPDLFSFRRNNVDVDAAYSGLKYTTLHVEYGYDKTTQTARQFDSSHENLVRVAADMVGNAWLSLRAAYEHSKRTAEGLDPDYFVEDGVQPGTYQYDIASRNRDDGSVFLTVNATPAVGLNASVTAGRDTYPDSAFGLLNNRHQAYTVGLDVVPRQHVTFGASYGFQKFTGTQASRNASPPPDPSFTNPAGNWNADRDEHVHTFDLNLALGQLLPKTEIRFAYDYNTSDQAYIYSGGRVAQLVAVGQFGQLPNVTNTWNQLSADARYFIKKNLAVGATYWFDKYSVADFATPRRVDELGALLLNYGVRPFTAHTVFGRVVVVF